MKPKSSAHYQREYRRRLREQGLVKKEVWIRPEHGHRLAVIEKHFRETSADPSGDGLGTTTDTTAVWNTRSLCEVLLEVDAFTEGRGKVELIEGVEPSIQVTLAEYGDLPVFVTVYGGQIIAEAVLWPVGDVCDTASFNETVLRTHKYFPLSTISMDTLSDGTEYYQMFGALSAGSRIENVVLEIETLAGNVIQAVEAFGEYLATAVEA